MSCEARFAIERTVCLLNSALPKGMADRFAPLRGGAFDKPSPKKKGRPLRPPFPNPELPETDQRE